MIKINWENHTNIKCDIECSLERDVIKCSGIVNDHKNILEIGNNFKFGTLNATLIMAKYNTENPNVWYEFENKKEGF